MGHKVSASSIPKLLEQLQYRRHVNRKTKDGSHHPDRDAQFEYINVKAQEFQAADQPAVGACWHRQLKDPLASGQGVHPQKAMDGR
jgi:hypothetical protein